jgi:hypothetical protein
VVRGTAWNGILRGQMRSFGRSLFAGRPLLAQLVAQPGIRLLGACHGVSSSQGVGHHDTTRAAVRPQITATSQGKERDRAANMQISASNGAASKPASTAAAAPRTIAAMSVAERIIGDVLRVQGLLF